MERPTPPASVVPIPFTSAPCNRIARMAPMSFREAYQCSPIVVVILQIGVRVVVQEQLHHLGRLRSVQGAEFAVGSSEYWALALFSNKSLADWTWFNSAVTMRGVEMTLRPALSKLKSGRWTATSAPSSRKTLRYGRLSVLNKCVSTRWVLHSYFEASFQSIRLRQA
jgi:hypothetical protein